MSAIVVYSAYRITQMRRLSRTRYCSCVYSVDQLTGAESAAGESQCREKVTAAGSIATRRRRWAVDLYCNFLTIV